MMPRGVRNGSLPLGSSIQQITSDAIETFRYEVEDHLKYLEDVLLEVKTHFGKRESTFLLPKTPCAKRKRRAGRKRDQNDENVDPSSTEDEQENEKKVKVDQSVVALPLQAISENGVLDTSCPMEETGRQTRSRRTKKSASQPDPAPLRRSSRRTKKQASDVLETTLTEEDGQPRRVTRSRKKKGAEKTSEPESPTVVTEGVVSVEAAIKEFEKKAVADDHKGDAVPREHLSKAQVAVADSTTETSAAGAKVETPEFTDKCEGEGKKKSSTRSDGVSETPPTTNQPTPNQCASSSQKVIRKSLTVVLHPADVKHLTPTFVLPTHDKESERSEVDNYSELEKLKSSSDLNEKGESVSRGKDAKKRKSGDVKGDFDVSSSVKACRVECSSYQVAVEEEAIESIVPDSPTGPEEEADQNNKGSETPKPVLDPDVSSTVVLSAKGDSNHCRRQTRTMESNQVPEQSPLPRSLTKPRSSQKTHSLVKSTVTLTLTRSPLMPASRIDSGNTQGSSMGPGRSDNAEQCSDFGGVKQNLFGSIQSGSDSDDKSDDVSSTSPQSAGIVSSPSSDDRQPHMDGSSSGPDERSSDDVDGQRIVTSQEENNEEEEEEVFHYAHEGIQEATAAGADVVPSEDLEIKTSSSDDEEKKFARTPGKIAGKKQLVAELPIGSVGKDWRPANLVTIHSFIKRNTPQKATLEEEKKRRAIALKKKQEKEQERREQLGIQKQKEAEERKRKREEREKRVAELRAQKAKFEEERKRKMQEKLEQKKSADEKAKKRREKEEDLKKRHRQQKKAELDARRKQDEETRKQRLLEQEEEARRQRELVQMKLELEEQERQKKIAEMKRQQEARERELERERELDKERKLREIEEKQRKQRQKDEREREEKARRAAEEKERKAREREAKEREEREKKVALEEERMQRKAREAAEKQERERVRIAKLIQEKEEQVRLEKLRQQNEVKLREAREAERKRQDELKRQAAEKQRIAAEESRRAVAAVESYEMTPPPPPKPRKPASSENYDITDLCSDDSTDDETAPKKKVPLWAQGNALLASLMNQELSSVEVEKFFGSISPPDLDSIFKKKRKRFYQRTSSACWDSPPRKSHTFGTQV